MWKLLKLVMLAAFVVGFIWFGRNVHIGRFTLFGHVERIWASDEAKELRDSTEQEAKPVVEKVKRGVEAGVKEVAREEAGRQAQKEAQRLAGDAGRRE